jgi:RNA polymerase sigma factor for flagellar operon FliA
LPSLRDRPLEDTTSPGPVDTDVAALWRTYASTGDAEALLLHYRPLVDQIARRLGSDLPAFLDRADLVSYGVLGLIDAVGKFDPDRGVRFEAYASIRIRGAILDGLRNIDWVPRSVRTGIRDVERAESALQMTLHRRPTEAEVAAAVGMDVATLRRLSADAALSRVVPLDDMRAASRLDRAESSVLGREARGDQPGHALETAERHQAVATAIEELSDRDRAVILLYYYRGLKLTEIGRLLGVTEARVCQLHARARSALKKTLLAMDIQASP